MLHKPLFTSDLAVRDQIMLLNQNLLWDAAYDMCKCFQCDLSLFSQCPLPTVNVSLIVCR